MNDSIITIRTVGSRRLCRGYLRVPFSGFYSLKGASLSPSGVGLGPFLVLFNLFTGLVAPTTCMYVRFRRKSGVGYVRFRRG